MEVREDEIVSQLSLILAKEWGVFPSVADRLRVAAKIHDVGKQKISDAIVNKPGKLDNAEFQIMKTHTTHGAEILSSVQGDLGIMARTICLYHHEWYDGTGYWGKFSCDLPAYVSIVSICDVFVALLSARTYKIAWPPKEAIEYISKKAGTQFNPMMVNLFIRLVQHDNSVKSLFPHICDME